MCSFQLLPTFVVVYGSGRRSNDFKRILGELSTFSFYVSFSSTTIIINQIKNKKGNKILSLIDTNRQWNSFILIITQF